MSRSKKLGAPASFGEWQQLRAERDDLPVVRDPDFAPIPSFLNRSDNADLEKSIRRPEIVQ
jgi:hypothetical protein